MPSKEELLNQLKSKALRVFFLEKHYEMNKKDYYEFYRYYYTDENGVLRSEAVCIHVIVDEEGNENAYWKDRIPTVLKSRLTSFSDELRSKIEEVKEAKGLDVITVENVDENNKVAILRVFKSVDQENVQEFRVAIWKDKQGNWHHKVVK